MSSYTLITGATSGIGYAIAKEFANEGRNLIIASRNQAKMIEIKKDFEEKYKIEVVYYQIDLGIADKALDLFKFCEENSYQVDILVNNAGIGLGPRIQTEQSLEDTMKLLNINLVSLTQLSTLFGKKMKENNNGYILNIASTAAFQPMPYAAIYGASKAYVLSISEAMNVELQDSNVGITASCPGITDTNFFTNGKPNISRWIYKLISPEMVAKKSIKAMYKKKLYVIPYFQHWLIAQISRFLTRRGTVRLMKQVEKRRKKVIIM
jgi:short-subunit dehydrogenase